MGQTVAYVIASGMCCCFNCCCQQCSQAFKRLMGMQRVTKILYVLLIFFYTVPAIFIFFLIYNWTDFLHCPNSSNFQCIGASSVYRLSFSLLILFILMFLLTLCRNKFAMVFNQGVFFLKYCFVVILFIGLLWVSNDIFTGYATASKYVSIAFMIIQSIILIDLFYLSGIKLVKRYDQGQTYCAVALILLSVLFETPAIIMNVLGYIYSTSIFNTTDICGSSLWVNIITTLILIILPAAQFLHFNKQNSLLTTAMVSLYVSYLSFIAQFSYTNGTQSSFIQQQCTRMTLPALISDVIISTGFFILSMYGTIMGGTGQVKITRNVDINKVVGVVPSQPRPQNEIQEPSLDKKNPVVEQEQNQKSNLSKYTSSCIWPLFHFHMCLASIYVGMLITNWTSASLITGQLQSDGFGFWVRVSIAWATTLLYLWTLIVPRIFPNRDFIVQ